MTLYLVRHGQSTWNAERRTQGQTAHPPLTAEGRAQAERAAWAIATDLAAAGRGAELLLTSDLVRARETASIIGARLALEPAVDARLREQGVGALEGLGYDAAYAAAADLDWTDPDLPIGGGESARDVHTRMAAVLDEVGDGDGSDGGGSVVVVSHGDALRFALGHLAGHGPGDCPWVAIGSGAVFAVGGSGGDGAGVDVRELTPAPAPRA